MSRLLLRQTADEGSAFGADGTGSSCIFAAVYTPGFTIQKVNGDHLNDPGIELAGDRNTYF